MGILLAINTATESTEIAFLREGEVLREGSWPAEANESDKILPYLRESLEELGGQFADLSGIFCVKGPGQFTALRVGITIVNTLAFLLKIPIYTMDTFKMISARSGLSEPHYVVLPAGRDKIFWDRFPERFSEVQSTDSVPSDLPRATFGNVKSTGFGEFLAKKDLGEMEKCDILEPLYIRPPNISASSD